MIASRDRGSSVFPSLLPPPPGTSLNTSFTRFSLIPVKNPGAFRPPADTLARRSLRSVPRPQLPACARCSRPAAQPARTHQGGPLSSPHDRRPSWLPVVMRIAEEAWRAGLPRKPVQFQGLWGIPTPGRQPPVPGTGVGLLQGGPQPATSHSLPLESVWSRQPRGPRTDGV